MVERQSRVFGKRKEPHTIIIARGDDIRHFQVRPWIAALAGSALAAIAIGYLAATSYLVLRDDLIGASVSRQARMQQAYEDRISALRAQVDRITSRQLLDQQLMEGKVAELLDRQTRLSSRDSRLGKVLGLTPGELGEVPLPTPKPDQHADAGADMFVTASIGPAIDSGLLGGLFGKDQQQDGNETAADRADRLFVEINQSLRSIESTQVARIAALTENAYKTVDTVADAVRSAGLTLDVGGERASGGPLISADPARRFDDQVAELDSALERLDKVRSKVSVMPVANPLPGQALTSSFGNRRDPILGTMAFHSGMDFRAPTGQPVRASAAGTVVKAGWNGGYGQMVEIDHGHGLTTRYAHMSAIAVHDGQKIQPGDVVGKVGSTGRSTGPHLHYEIRRNGDALDPLTFIKAGRKISGLL